jgi:D-3-phosphoglycerate dehydrogenase
VDVKTDLERGVAEDHREAMHLSYSATKVTRDIIEKADRLKVTVGWHRRDNVTSSHGEGIVVMNTPQGNASPLRNTRLHCSCNRTESTSLIPPWGKWEKKILMGVEVYDKTLGVIGIGNIGLIVAEKAIALGMNVIAYDLFVPKEVAEARGIALVDLDTLLARSDFITVHVPMLKETKNLIDKKPRQEDKRRDHPECGQRRDR